MRLSLATLQGFGVPVLTFAKVNISYKDKDKDKITSSIFPSVGSFCTIY